MVADFLFILTLLIILFCLSQYFKRQRGIKFAELKAEQRHVSSFEVIYIMLDIKLVILIFKRFEHDSWMLGSNVVNGLS